MLTERQKQLLSGMKSVMVFEPNDSQEETERKWVEWNLNKSAVQDKAVPNVEATQRYLNQQKSETV